MKRSAIVLVTISLLSVQLLTAAEPAPTDVTVNVNDKTMAAMKSPWADYFGTHYASAPDKVWKTWNIVRSFGGTHVGIAAENPAAPPRSSSPNSSSTGSRASTS